MSYPCGCSPLEVVNPDPCPTGNCLKLPNVTIDPLTSVLPCGGTFSVDIGQYADFSACDGTVVWNFHSYDNTVFENMAISSAGVVTGSTAAGAINHVGEWFDIVVKAACPTSILSVLRTIKMPIRNACFNVTCDPGKSCNPCTGLCIDQVPDINLD